jgi:FecR protein
MHAMHRLLSLTILIVFMAAPTLAQQAPPARVGRVSFVSGNLAFHTAGQTEWSAAAVNYPVATGASLWTDADSRAEVRIAPDTTDMASNTELDVTELGERVSRLGVPQGRINLHLRHLDQGQSFEIDIPRGAVQLLQPGYYDIDAGTQDQPARVAVFEGSAQFIGGGTDIAIKAGDVATLNGLSPVTASFEPAVADAFVEWCRSRDYDEKRLAAPYHVSPNMTGYVELDEYGRWDSAPGYGEVWYPNVPPGWAPYTNGRWVWVAPWGWTWVDAEPWGFAPCHYGRWAWIGDSWGWAPGAFEPSPVYAPALVAFVGGVGVGLYVSGAAGPQVGWFPLAPGEAYWPSYTADPSYIRSINRSSVGNIDNIQMMRNVMLPAQIANAQFANRRFATVVPQHVFASAGSVGAAALRPPSSAAEHNSVTMRPPQVTPAPARSLPGPVAMGMRGPQGPVAEPRSERAGGVGLAAPSKPAGLQPPPGTAFGGPQSGRETSSAALAPPGHPDVASPQGGGAVTPQSLAGQEKHPAWPDAAHPHAPAQAFHPPAQMFHPPAQAPQPVRAFHAPAQALRPVQAFHAPAQAAQPVQAFRPPAQAFHPPATSAQQVAHASQAAKGGGAPPQAPKGGGPAPAHDGKGDKHD